MYVFVFKTFQVIFKHIKKLIKIFFSIYKNDNYLTIIKNSESLSEEENDKRQKKARERYQNFTEEENKKRHNKNLSEEQKKKLAEYRRNYYLAHKK